MADPQGWRRRCARLRRRFFGVDGGSRDVVREDYDDDCAGTSGAGVPGRPPGDPHAVLEALLQALDADDATAVSATYAAFAGRRLEGATDWREALGAELARNELAFKLAERLAAPQLLSRLVDELQGDFGRPIQDEEILAWLALGAAALRNGRPVLRPVVHGFIRGIGGAVVAFPPGREGPELRLGASEAWGAPAQAAEPPLVQLPVLTCSTCGQHYFVQHAKDFSFGQNGPDGGDAVNGGSVWSPLDPELGGRRVVLLDQLVDLEPDDDDDDAVPQAVPAAPAPAPAAPLPAGAAVVHLCRHCGALHPTAASVCLACGRTAPPVRMIAPRTDPPPNSAPPAQPVLSRCISCGAQGQQRGTRFREPMRPVRATTVSDIHVLAQEMVRHAERQRLLVFADNRQDAAFQAGWMRDHARRFRLRALVDQELSDQPIAVGDLVARLDRRLNDDPDLSRALLPEVWNEFGAGDAPVEHEQHRRLYLRFFLIRELAAGPRQRIGLEPWGRARVNYVGLDERADFIRLKAAEFGIAPAVLADGVGALLDHLRRSMLLFDPETRAYSRIFDLDDRVVQRGYFPHLKAGPKGMRLQRDPTDRTQRSTAWLGRRPTFCSKTFVKWGIPRGDVPEFTRELWAFLCDQVRILKAVDLTGGGNRVIRGGNDVRQIDVERLRLVRHSGAWRCKRCRRNYTRPIPDDRCLGFHCTGNVGFEAPDPDDYDLLLLTGGGAMIKPREHSAQVPEAEQERLENAFKADGDTVNTLVCTPTLELGVDIGHLDTVLMRNVPPRPANYWQRAGRAGRRRRMAVCLTYARPISHDQSYFADPVKMLAGAVEPPRFNLLNDELVRKHAHSSFVTCLRRLAAERPDTPAADRIRETLALALPQRVTTFLFDDQERVRTVPYDLTPLRTLLADLKSELLAYVRGVYTQHWPLDSAPVVDDRALDRYLVEMPDRLDLVIKLLERRLRWAQDQQRRLTAVRVEKGTLEPDEDALFRRCDRIIKRLKGNDWRTRREAEGRHDASTYSALAAEGFFPGYGLDIGSIVGSAEVPRFAEGGQDFELPRPPAVALREYAPGNLIYANGVRFVPRRFHFDDDSRPVFFAVDIANEAVVEQPANAAASASLQGVLLPTVKMTDVELVHASRIDDEEEHRFQMPVGVYGLENGPHSGGTRYTWGGRDVLWRKSVELRLVNVGSTSQLGAGVLGFPLCGVCGDTRTPFASPRELQHFTDSHRDRCGRPISYSGFMADVTADALTVPRCASPDEAYSVAEALRTAAAGVLQMERDDLQILVLRAPGTPECAAVLYDPMPGGSGLLDQLCDRFAEVQAEALRVVENCPSACARSCPDCLQTFRNQFFHRRLDRQLAARTLRTEGPALRREHPIPPVVKPTANQPPPAPFSEAHFAQLLKDAGFEDPEWHRRIELGRPVKATKPDCYYPLPDDPTKGLCIYVDGLSSCLHGNAERHAIDLAIREELRSRGFEVVEISAQELWDRGAMVQHFARIARALIDRNHAQRLREQTDWYRAPERRT
jgi:hypothetical protein